MLALKLKWYQKLKDSGFHDIEHSLTHELKVCHARYFTQRYSFESFLGKQRYFELIAQFLHAYPFRDPLEKKVFELHCLGFSMREISFKLRTPLNKLNKDKVNQIILKYVHLMKHSDLSSGSDLDGSGNEEL